jgi:hypothetical protein
MLPLNILTGQAECRLDVWWPRREVFAPETLSRRFTDHAPDASGQCLCLRSKELGARIRHGSPWPALDGIAVA